MSVTATPEEIESFLASTKFSGYQSLPLPHGRRVPGKDMEARAEYILGDRVRDRTMLEVGTYYGAFPEAALRRGAKSATGLEPDPERGAIAAEIARLNGERYEIIQGGLDDLEAGTQFDVVLFLRVLHHVIDPIAVMKQLAALTRELLIVEFSLASDKQYMKPSRNRHGRASAAVRLRTAFTSRALRWLAGDLPLCAVGGEAYHRTWYFNPSAFENLFVTHHGLFSEVSFLPSSSDRAHAVGLCRPRRDGARSRIS
jgi:SAM-dependent methyltransferase